ncbi:hypothetical protein ACJW30_09G134900 [Castanea mollissima]
MCRSRWPIHEFHRSKISFAIVIVSNLIITTTAAAAATTAISNTSQLRRLYYDGTLIPIIVVDSQLFPSSLNAELSDDFGKLVLDVESDTSLTTVVLGLLRTSEPTSDHRGRSCGGGHHCSRSCAGAFRRIENHHCSIVQNRASVYCCRFCDWFFFFFFVLNL